MTTLFVLGGAVLAIIYGIYRLAMYIKAKNEKDAVESEKTQDKLERQRVQEGRDVLVLLQIFFLKL